MFYYYYYFLFKKKEKKKKDFSSCSLAKIVKRLSHFTATPPSSKLKLPEIRATGAVLRGSRTTSAGISGCFKKQSSSVQPVDLPRETHHIIIYTLIQYS